MTQPTPLIVVTSGEPAGIGPDICAMLAADNLPARLLTLGDPSVLQARIHELGLDVSLKVIGNTSEAGIHTPGTLQVLPIDTAKPVRPGQLDLGNVEYVLRLLDAGTELCADETGTALVTAPIQKSIINEAGIAFSGHTEWLAERTGAQKPVMMLASAQLRVALATTHVPLKAVPQAITRDSLEQVLRVLDRDLRARFALDSPRITVLGLNPHAGESGTLGREEREIIEPVIAELCDQGLSLTGPIPADTAFTRERLEECGRGIGHVPRSGITGHQSPGPSVPWSTSRWGCP